MQTTIIWPQSRPRRSSQQQQFDRDKTLICKNTLLATVVATAAFHRNDRAVQPPSRWQVRQPIYSKSVGKWRPPAPHLAELSATLSLNTAHRLS
jgi:hypothetical protein